MVVERGSTVIIVLNLDVDECTERTHDCDQTCVNTDGGFICSCPLPGYKLSENKASCIGMYVCMYIPIKIQ